MTTQEIADFVKGFGADEDAAFDALLEKLVSKEITMEEVEKAIGYGSAAFPYEYPYSETKLPTLPTFLTVLSVELDRANGNDQAFCC